jgi:SET domain-containing protein
MSVSAKQSWMNPKLGIRESGIHDKGVFATEAIERGERLVIFGGEVMRIDEIKDLPDGLQDFPMQIEERFVLGCRRALGPEEPDFINHSCDPNGGFRGQVFLVAMRDIGRDEEITFDYAMVVSESQESTVLFEMDCACGSPLCRGRITEDDWKLPELRKRYAGFFSQYLQERIDRDDRGDNRGPGSGGVSP